MNFTRLQRCIIAVIFSTAFVAVAQVTNDPRFVLIQAGSFTMGSASGAFIEQPAHDVQVDAFLMGRYEVTYAEFRAFVKSPEYKAVKLVPCNYYDWTDNLLMYGSCDGYWISHQRGSATDSLPVEGVNWYLAANYCNWLSVQEGLTPVYVTANDAWSTDPKANGYRMPTEAEWEYACRAGTTNIYWWGDVMKGRHCNFGDSNLFASFTSGLGSSPYMPETEPPANGERDGFKETCSVDAGRIFENPWGLAHMSGNVAEWCSDSLTAYTADNQPGREFGNFKVVRGGGWHSGASQCTSSYRSWLNPERLMPDVGFRLVRQIPKP